MSQLNFISGSGIIEDVKKIASANIINRIGCLEGKADDTNKTVNKINTTLAVESTKQKHTAATVALIVSAITTIILALLITKLKFNI